MINHTNRITRRREQAVTYLIESPHTKEECLQALDDVLARGPEFLAKFEWGCMSGEHTGWAVVEAGSEAAARSIVPVLVRSKARIVEVGKITPEQIKSFHGMGR
jgi:hypothetical protein